MFHAPYKIKATGNRLSKGFCGVKTGHERTAIMPYFFDKRPLLCSTVYVFKMRVHDQRQYSNTPTPVTTGVLPATFQTKTNLTSD
jgi:hypothetical protein